MLKPLIFSLLILLAISGLHAQTLSRDSLVKLANADVRNFKLNRSDFKRFRKSRSNSYSDLFKPTKATVADTTLLTDSVYVNAFRNAAYGKTRKRHTTGHYFLIGGTIYVAANFLAGVVIILVLLAKGN